MFIFYNLNSISALPTPSPYTPGGYEDSLLLCFLKGPHSGNSKGIEEITVMREPAIVVAKKKKCPRRYRLQAPYVLTCLKEDK
jgi:hypothetical protein